MPDTFFCEDLSGPAAVLEASEAHHALHVLRLKTGDALRLTDGRGTIAEAVVAKAKRSSVEVEISESAFHERRESSVTVASAVPKGDRLKWMIEKLAELGVDRFVPLQTQRSVVDAKRCSPDKLRPTLIGAAKQSRQAWLMGIEEPTTVEAFAESFDGSLYVAHPGTAGEQVSSAAARAVIIGPEGGLTDAEVAQLQATGAHTLSWPGSILRIETAAIAFAVGLLK